MTTTAITLFLFYTSKQKPPQPKAIIYFSFCNSY